MNFSTLNGIDVSTHFRAQLFPEYINENGKLSVIKIKAHPTKVGFISVINKFKNDMDGNENSTPNSSIKEENI
jgi:hypothetical protein